MTAKIMNNEIIVLIHGLMRSHRSMYRLESYLLKQGYETYSYHYPSTKYTISEHGVQFQSFIEGLLLANASKNLHFITHSLGGIIAREALSKLTPKKLNRCNSLIMLAPPNQGSLLAKLCLTITPFLSSFIKPLAELSCDHDAYVHQVGVPEQVKIGTIAGRFDAKVPPSATHMSRQNDFVIINSTHTFIMNHPKTRKVILNFLQSGNF
ncbi:MAG: alpha/beta fold hydrolase [Gammaproteobacteria bacterium]|nr:alpha/beta fold hydrolase [Gammaproteobacteria bacterium]